MEVAAFGAMLSTVNVALAADEVPEATVIPTVPFPAQLERVTVGVAVVPPLTAFVQVAVLKA